MIRILKIKSMNFVNAVTFFVGCINLIHNFSQQNKKNPRLHHFAVNDLIYDDFIIQSDLA